MKVADFRIWTPGTLNAVDFMKSTFVVFAIILVSAIGAFSQSSDERTKAAILKVISEQSAAWNNGDIDGFMKGYWNSPEMTFVSGDSVTKGWTPTLERYKRSYNTRAKMGVLSFTELQVTVLSKKSAVVLGRFTLVRENDKPTGMFTLTFRKLKEGWRIILDHTS
ncbi:MAG: nuclear transport factor 2 family protein [Acidobacteria bacterium]|nr:nuclear transport factor 2 family protein [Acidobacteriota bacterium]MBK8813828.1 nuclear transport factor 2 family protein [Acidobacteriota bacterium]